MSQIVEDIINEINVRGIHEGRKLMLYEMRPIMEKYIAKVERPNGKWIEGKNGTIKCNQCGCEIKYSYLIGIKPDFPKFCCDCGADMRGEEE